MAACIFIISISIDVFMEKHWKSVIPRSICDYFFDAQRKANSNEDIPPVITTPHHYLISVLRSNLFFVAVCMTEVPTIFLITYMFQLEIFILKDNIDEYCEATMAKICGGLFGLKRQISDNWALAYKHLNNRCAAPCTTDAHTTRYDKPALFKYSHPHFPHAKHRQTLVGRFTGDVLRVWYYGIMTHDVDAILSHSSIFFVAWLQRYTSCSVLGRSMPPLATPLISPKLFDEMQFRHYLAGPNLRLENILRISRDSLPFHLYNSYRNRHILISVIIHINNN
ncbi:unnamed protein product, partial [Meganyctiphanes norvegica]